MPREHLQSVRNRLLDSRMAKIWPEMNAISSAETRGELTVLFGLHHDRHLPHLLHLRLRTPSTNRNRQAGFHGADVACGLPRPHLLLSSTEPHQRRLRSRRRAQGRACLGDGRSRSLKYIAGRKTTWMSDLVPESYKVPDETTHASRGLTGSLNVLLRLIAFSSHPHDQVHPEFCGPLVNYKDYYWLSKDEPAGCKQAWTPKDFGICEHDCGH